MGTKKFWQSRTMWVNLLAALAIMVQSQAGFVIDENEQVAIIIIINIVLRAITSEGLTT